MKALRVPFAGVVRESKLSACVVRGFAEAVEQAGVSRARLFAAAHFDGALLDRMDATVPRADFYRLCECAIELTRDPALGLHWGERLSATAFDPISHLVAHSETLRQGFESLFKFYRLLSDQPDFHLSEEGDHVTFQYFSPSVEGTPIQRFASEVFATGIFRTIRAFTPQARLERVSFEHSAPEYLREYTRVFERAAHFDQPFTGVVFDRALMDAVSAHRDGDVHDALRAIAERRILGVTQREPFSLRVREWLVQHGPACRTDMNVVARSLGLSARSLRRRLAAEGKSYNAVVDEAMATIAKHFLRHKQLTIQEVAYEMGFADKSTFHRAFKRWTGMTPTEVRQEQQDNGAARLA